MIEIIRFDPMEKGTLIGKIGIKIHKWGGFCIEDLALMSKDGKRWIGFPSKKSEVDGKEKWVPQIYFDSPQLQKKFCEEILKSLDEWKK